MGVIRHRLCPLLQLNGLDELVRFVEADAFSFLSQVDLTVAASLKGVINLPRQKRLTEFGEYLEFRVLG